VMCRAYDRAALIGVRDQLLAEAVNRYKAAERFWPNREEEELWRGEQDRREKIDPWLEIIEEWLGTLTKNWVTVSEILGDCLKIDYGRMDGHMMATRVGQALNKIGGWARKEDRTGTKCGARYFYEKVSVDE
jgi:predicted P-loop ATPase